MPEYARLIWVIVASLLGAILGVVIGARIVLKGAEATVAAVARRVHTLHNKQHPGCTACDAELEEIFDGADATPEE